MWRRLLNLLTALSLLLCVGAAAMWVRSRHAYDNVIWCRGRTFVRGESAGGTFGVYWMADCPDARALGPHHRRVPVDPFDGGWDLATGKRHQFWRFAYDDTRTLTSAPGPAQTSTPGSMVVAPYWSLTAAAGALRAWRLGATLAGHRTRRRRRRGLCPSCGYDVRATPDRCPECGNQLGSGDCKLLRTPV